MRFSIATLAILTGLAGTLPASAQDSAPSGQSISVDQCYVRLINEVNIPAEANGKLTLVDVDQGSAVKEGQLIATIDDQQAKLTVELKEAEELESKLKAENEVNILAAEAAMELAKTIADAFVDLASQNAAKQFDMKQKVLEAERSELAVELAKRTQQQEQALYKAKIAERKLAEFALSQRQIKAPFDGVIDRKSVSTGEWVEPGTPVLRIVDLQNLKVVGAVDSRHHDAQSLYGMPVAVDVKVREGVVKRFNGRVRFVGLDVDINNRVQVEAEIENQLEGGNWVVLPGMPAAMHIQQKPQLASVR